MKNHTMIILLSLDGLHGSFFVWSFYDVSLLISNIIHVDHIKSYMIYILLYGGRPGYNYCILTPAKLHAQNLPPIIGLFPHTVKFE